ncbi:MAG: biopolymer transporter ExbD [Proteobacteria bacterium]|nr:biopolymer transporter ExbD [Pseudomonadota bacterium]
MSFEFGSGGNGGARYPGARYKRTQISQINVTPMVDVMLVLLVVFMITAPLLTVGVPIDLPKTAASRIVGQDEPLVVSLAQDGKIYLQDAALALDELIPRLIAITENRKEARIFLRGDRAIAYGQVMIVMGAMNQAGFSRVALLTEMPGKKAPAGRGKSGVR